MYYVSWCRKTCPEDTRKNVTLRRICFDTVFSFSFKRVFLFTSCLPDATSCSALPLPPHVLVISQPFILVPFLVFYQNVPHVYYFSC